MDPGSLESFSAIAYRCVNKAREERPTMGEIVKELEFSLEQQEISEKTVDYSQPAPISDGDDLEDDFQTQAGGTSGFPMRSHAFSQPRQVTTVVLKLRMHCEACAQKIRKCILRMKGVKSVEPDLKASRVSVRGTFETLQLVDYLYKRIGKKAIILKQDPELKKENNNGKEEEKDAGEKKEERKANANSNAKKDMEKEEENDGSKKKEEKKKPTPTAVPKKIRRKKKKNDGSEKKEENKTNANNCVKKDKENGEKEDGSEKEEEKKPTPTTVPKKDDEKKANGYVEKDKEKEGKKDGDGEERAEADNPAAGGYEEGDDTKVDLFENETYYHQQSYALRQLMYPYTPEMFSDDNPHSCTVM